MMSSSCCCHCSLRLMFSSMALEQRATPCLLALLSEIAIGSWNDLDQWIDCAPAAALAIGVVADAVEAGEAELSWTDAAVRWHARLMTSRGPDPSVRVWKEVASAELDRIEGRDSRDAWRRALAQVGARPYVEATIQRQLAAAIEAAGEAGPESGELREAARRTAVRLGAKPLLAALDEDAAESSDN